MKWMKVASRLACTLLVGIASAHASVGLSTATIGNDIAACHKLPLSERGICKAQSNRHFNAMAASMTPGSALPATAFVMPQPAVAQAERDRYRSLAAACHHDPVSERNTCLDEASLGLARPA